MSETFEAACRETMKRFPVETKMTDATLVRGIFDWLTQQVVKEHPELDYDGLRATLMKLQGQEYND